MDKFAPRLSFFFNAHSNFLEEVAKFRAARRMWARIMRDHFGAKNAKSQMLRFHTQTAGSTLTAQQPENNIVRTALQAMAAVLGGTQSLHTNSFDEALALPTEQSARIALRTQQIIAYESGAAQTIDPLAGSYYVESLTNQIEAGRARLSGQNRSHGRHVEGDRARLRAAGDPERRLRVSAKGRSPRSHRCRRERFRSLTKRSRYRCSDIDESLERKQVERLRALRAKRDQAKWQAALKQVEDTARGTGNLMPAIVEAVEANATVGEISDAMRRRVRRVPRDGGDLAIQLLTLSSLSESALVCAGKWNGRHSSAQVLTVVGDNN